MTMIGHGWKQGRERYEIKNGKTTTKDGSRLGELDERILDMRTGIGRFNDRNGSRFGNEAVTRTDQGWMGTGMRKHQMRGMG